MLDEKKSKINENIGHYDKSTHKVIKIKEIRYKKHYQVMEDSAIHQLILIGANCQTLVYEYLSANMDYNNEINPNISEMSKTIQKTRGKTSNSLTKLEKLCLITPLDKDQRIGRKGRSFMINPLYRNKGRAEDIPAKIKKWHQLIEQNLADEKKKEIQERIKDSDSKPIENLF